MGRPRVFRPLRLEDKIYEVLEAVMLSSMGST